MFIKKDFSQQITRSMSISISFLGGWFTCSLHWFMWCFEVCSLTLFHFKFHSSQIQMKLFKPGFNSLRLRQNGCQNDIFKCISLNENFWFLNRIALKYVHQDLTINMATFVQIIALHQSGDKPLSEAMLVWFTNAYMHHSASMSLW